MAGKISGTVTDESTGDPLEATIYVYAWSDGSLKKTLTSSPSDGKYSTDLLADTSDVLVVMQPPSGLRPLAHGPVTPEQVSTDVAKLILDEVTNIDPGASVYDPNDDESVTVRSANDNSFVVEIKDGMGNRGPLVQNTDAEQFELVETSTLVQVLSNRNRDNKGMDVEFSSDIQQPNTVFSVGLTNQPSFGDFQRLLDSKFTSGRQIIGARDNDERALWAGSWVSTGQFSGNYEILQANYNGSDSELFVDGVSVKSSNGGSNNLGGLEIGRQDQTDKNVWSGDIGPVIVFTDLFSNEATQTLRDIINEHYPIGESS